MSRSTRAWSGTLRRSIGLPARSPCRTSWFGCGKLWPRFSGKESEGILEPILTVVLEPDLEMSDDGSAWQIVWACEGHPPRNPIVGFYHRPKCACREGNLLCNVGWLEEFVRQVGVETLIEGELTKFLPKEAHLNRLKIKGRMVASGRDEDYDEHFELQDVEVVG